MMNGHAGNGHFKLLDQLPDVARQNIQTCYQKNFPFLKERRILHSWIEREWPHWQQLDVNNPMHIQYVNNLIPSLRALTGEAGMKQLHGDQLKFRDAIVCLSQTYEQKPWEMVKGLCVCLNYELQMVQKHQTGQPIQSEMDKEHQNLNQKLQDLLDRSVVLRDSRSAHRTAIEEFNRFYSLFKRLKDYLCRVDIDKTTEQYKKNVSDKQQYETGLISKQHLISSEREQLFTEMVQLLEETNIAQNIVDSELSNWKREQQLSGNGGTLSTSLEMIQSWFECLAQILWSVKLTTDLFVQDVQELPNLKTDARDYVQDTPRLQNQTKNLLYILVRRSFIIEKQPPQVMKTSTRFGTVVRLLVGANLGINTSPPQLKASIVSEAYAKDLVVKPHLQDSDIPAKDNCGTLLNASAMMEHNAQSRSITANFRQMQLSKIKRTEKKGSECVMDEKFAIAFQSHIRIAELVFPVFALSLPVVAIVHGNQEPHAWATVTWDNAFALPDRYPFYAPEKKDWYGPGGVGEMLSMKFRQYVGKPLTDEALSYLAIKACRVNNNNYGKDIKQLCLSWSFFAKEPLPERAFTFWEWFYAILKVTQQHLAPLWKEGAILGFVDKEVSVEMIKNHLPGTFVLRFSDSELGGVSISFVTMRDEGGTDVLMTAPFTAKDFQIRSLADRINDLKNLLYLMVPGCAPIPKDQKFAKHYSPIVDRPALGGYVKPQLACTLPGNMSQLSISDSQPATPLSYPASSPESHQNLSHVNEYLSGAMGGSNGYNDGYMNHQDIPTGSESAYSPSSSVNEPLAIDDLYHRLIDQGVLDDLDIDIPDTIGNITDFDDSFQMNS